MAQRSCVINWVLTRTGGACAAILRLQPLSGVMGVIRWWMGYCGDTTTTTTHTHIQSYSNETGRQRVVLAAVLFLGCECVTQSRLQQTITLTRETLPVTATIRLTAGTVCLAETENWCMWAWTRQICVYVFVRVRMRVASVDGAYMSVWDPGRHMTESILVGW